MSTWTPERRARAGTLWNEGKSATEIARILGGVSRNAVIGIIHRAGLSTLGPVSAPSKVTAAPKPPKPPKPARVPPAPKLRIAVTNGGGVRVFEESVAEEPKFTPPAQAFSPLPGSSLKTLADRPAFACCWPVGGEGADTLFCCERVEAETDSWCKAHKARGRVPTPPRRELIRSLRRYTDSGSVAA